MKRRLSILLIVLLLSSCATSAVVGAAGTAGAMAVRDTHKVLHAVRKAII